MWRILLWIEGNRCKKDVKKLREQLLLLTNTKDKKNLEDIILLRELLTRKDFYRFVDKKELKKYK